MPTYIPTNELLKQVGNVHPDTLKRWVKAGKFPKPVRVGRQRLWPVDEVMAALEASREAA
jgi:predicted DNA-binding transcriptional regulator AlpA